MSSLVSVVITVYNKRNWLRRAVDSVLTQSVQEFELIVVDDGSQDGSLEVLRGYRDQRIRVISKQNGGVSSARNAGLAVARGKYLAFLDADDEWLPWHLATALECFERHPDAGMVANRYLEIGDDSRSERPSSPPSRWNCLKMERYLDEISANRFSLWICSAVFAASALNRSGGRFDEKLRTGEDVNLFLKISLTSTVYLSEVVAALYHRCDGDSLMTARSQKLLLVPDYFRGVELPAWPAREARLARSFMCREYLKRAFQNRGLPLRGSEFDLSGYRVAPAGSSRLWYLLVRFFPDALLRPAIRCRNALVSGGSNA